MRLHSIPVRRIRTRARVARRAPAPASRSAALAVRSTNDVPVLLVVEPQCRLDWCWAAVAVSVARVRGAAPGNVPTQCAFAYGELHAAGLPVTPSLCCGGDCDAERVDDCSAPMELDDALFRLGCLAAENGIVAGPPSEELLISELAQGRPVCGRIYQSGSVSHFGAVVGMYTDPSGTVWFLVSDPIYAPGTVSPQTIHSLHSDYCAKGGRWVTSYRTT